MYDRGACVRTLSYSRARTARPKLLRRAGRTVRSQRSAHPIAEAVRSPNRWTGKKGELATEAKPVAITSELRIKAWPVSRAHWSRERVVQAATR